MIMNDLKGFVCQQPVDLGCGCVPEGEKKAGPSRLKVLV